jgi:hypothetical protein
MNLFLSPDTAPFGVAVGLLVGLAILEALGLLANLSPGHALDNLIADTDGDGLLSWLHVGRTPIMVLLILFLAGFGLSGYIMQAMLAGLTGHYAPAWLIAPGSLLVGVGVVRTIGGLIGRMVPKDETASVSEETLVGRTGEIMRGDARREVAAEARVRDEHGAVHYLMVEPDIDGETLEQGVDILIVRKIGARFRAIRNPHPQLR